MKKLNHYHLCSDARIVTDVVPGPEARKLLAQQKEKEGSIVSYPRKMPTAFKLGKGAILEDVDGNRFIDFFGGCGVLNVGHSNPYVLKEIDKQIKELIHILDFPTENKMQFIDKILAHLPDSLSKDFKIAFCAPTGSDAIEAAIKLAKLNTGRSGIIAFQGSYHGMTSGALAVTSDLFFRNKIRGLMPEVHFIPYSYCYRCPFGKTADNCSMECAAYLDHLLSDPLSGVPKPAAILLEPVQGEGGIVVPKKGFLKRIVDIAHKHDVLVIFDEVQSGFFRTGPFLSFLDSGTVPDIITMSKGLGGIGFPMAAILYKKEIEAWDMAAHIGTFRSNQVGIAAGRAALDFIDAHQIEAHVRKIGQEFQEKLRSYASQNPYIGQVRGEGLFVGLEYVKDKSSKIPFPEIIPKIRHEALQRGLLFEVGGHYGNVIRFTPPLIITRSILNNAMKIFKSANQAVIESLVSPASVQ